MADGDFFDPDLSQAGFSGLSDDDPLRAWAQQNVDPHTGALLATDPQAAIDKLVAAGVPPPPVNAGGRALGFAAGLDAGTGDDSPFMVRTNKDGSIAGNVSAPSNPDAPPKQTDRVTPNVPPVPLPAPARVASAGSSLDPEDESPSEAGSVPLPQPRPEAAKAGDTKKKDLAGGLSDFSKSLQGVKPVPPPALNAVGTPGVRSPNSIQAPAVQALLSLAGQGTPPSALATLGRLLAAGKV